MQNIFGNLGRGSLGRGSLGRGGARGCGCSTVIIIGLLLLAASFFLNSGNSGIGSDLFGGGGGDTSASLGRLTVAEAINEDGCATRTTSSLPAYTEEFSIVAEGSDVERGTDIFVRLYRDGQQYEDTDIITAPEDLRDACVYMIFDEPRGFEPGEYEAEWFVNGSAVDSIRFSIG